MKNWFQSLLSKSTCTATAGADAPQRQGAGGGVEPGGAHGAFDGRVRQVRVRGGGCTKYKLNPVVTHSLKPPGDPTLEPMK